MLTRSQIDELLSVPKKIITRKLSFSLDRSQRRCVFKLISLDGTKRFHGFARIHNIFEENFSVGLDYESEDGTNQKVIRVNGPHGPTRAQQQHHTSPHIHIGDALLDTIEISDEYFQLSEALMIYAQKCSIVNMEEFMDDNEPKNKELPFQEED